MNRTGTKFASVTAALGAVALAAGMTMAQPSAPKRQKGQADRRHHGHVIPWSRAEGRPNIQPGRTVGFYVWHEGDRVHVVTADESDRGRSFEGRIRAQGGTISDVKGYLRERPDKFDLNDKGVLRFRFDTHEHVDGLKFRLTGGKRLLMYLQLAGHRTDNIFIGKNAVEAGRSPIIFDLSK